MRIIFLILLIPSICSAQFLFDSVEVKKIEQIILKCDYLQVENDSLYRLVFLKDMKISNLMQESNLKSEIIRMKDEQLYLLEMTKVPVKESVDWYVWAGVILGSVATGMAIQTIIK